MLYIGCPVLKIENGKVTFSGRKNGDIAIYQCDLGYTLLGNDFRMCQMDRSWSGSDPTCQSKLAVP